MAVTPPLTDSAQASTAASVNWRADNPLLRGKTTSGVALRIRGGNALRGRIRIGGSKNLVLPALAAALLTAETCIYDNVPCIEDTRTMLRLLKHHGATVSPDPDSETFFSELAEHQRVEVRAADITTTVADDALARSMRASFLVAGPLLARCGHAQTPTPGGDDIGARPLDVAVRGFQRMGAEVEHDAEGHVTLSARRLNGTSLYLDYPSHTGTENLMMAAVLASGTTTIVNASAEPEVIAFGEMLNRMGANIQGLGTATLVVQGVSRLNGAFERIIPDRLVAGTYAVGAIITGGELLIENVRSQDMLPMTQKLREAGALVFIDDNTMLVRSSGHLKRVDVQALPFPGFPTDQQAVMAVLLTQCEGTSRVHERVFEDRLRYVHELNKMGAEIRIDALGVRAEIVGPKVLKGAVVEAKDIRAGAALVLAGLIAEGETIVNGVYHLDRGYERLVPTLQSVGADIESLSESEFEAYVERAS